MIRLRALIAVLGCWCAATRGMPFDQAYWIAVASSVVKIEVARGGGYSLGTGVVVGPDRVVTACHVLRGAAGVAVLHAGIRRNAMARVTAAERDLCVLRVPWLQAAPVAQRPTVQLSIGEDIGAIGFSAGAGIHYAHGAVARLHRYDDGIVVQGSAAFTSGASGGGLFDADGRLVGILMFRMRGAGPQYFAVPVEWFAAEIEDAGEAVDADIGGEPFWNRAPERLPYFMRANMLESEERWDDLEVLASRWRLDEPLNPEPAYLLGELNCRRDRLAEALSEFRDAVARDPGHALAWSGLVRASMRNGDREFARRAYAKLVPLSAVLAGRIATEFPEILE